MLSKKISILFLHRQYKLQSYLYSSYSCLVDDYVVYRFKCIIMCSFITFADDAIDIEVMETHNNNVRIIM